MPVPIPSAEDVQNAFRQAMANAIPQHQETDLQEYDRAYGSLMASNWAAVSPGIESVPVSEFSRLIRGSWEYTIDPHADGQFPIITAQATAFAAPLASMVAANASVALTLAPVKASAAPIGQRVECSFKASISSILRSTMSRVWASLLARSPPILWDQKATTARITISINSTTTFVHDHPSSPPHHTHSSPRQRRR